MVVRQRQRLAAAEFPLSRGSTTRILLALCPLLWHARCTVGSIVKILSHLPWPLVSRQSACPFRPFAWLRQPDFQRLTCQSGGGGVIHSAFAPPFAQTHISRCQHDGLKLIRLLFVANSVSLNKVTGVGNTRPEKAGSQVKVPGVFPVGSEVRAAMRRQVRRVRQVLPCGLGGLPATSVGILSPFSHRSQAHLPILSTCALCGSQVTEVQSVVFGCSTALDRSLTKWHPCMLSLSLLPQCRRCLHAPQQVLLGVLLLDIPSDEHGKAAERTLINICQLLSVVAVHTTPTLARAASRP